MGAMASQITSLTIVYSTVYSGTDQRKHQIYASLAFVLGIHRWPVNSPHIGPVTRKMFPFGDVIKSNVGSLSGNELFHRLFKTVNCFNCEKYLHPFWVIPTPLLFSLWQLSRDNQNARVGVSCRDLIGAKYGTIFSSRQTGKSHPAWFSWICLLLNRFLLSAAYMRQWNGSALVQIMACRLFGTKPLSEPVLTCCQLDP